MSNGNVMTVKTPKRIGYTVVPNGVLPEGKISARAWGLYVYLLSRPPGWEIRTPQLQKVFSEGRDAIYTALRELVEAGLMRLESYRTIEGLPRKRYVMIAPEKVTESPDTDFQDTGNQDAEKPCETTTDINQAGSKSDYTSNLRSDPPFHAQAELEPTHRKHLVSLIHTIGLHRQAGHDWWDDTVQELWDMFLADFETVIGDKYTDGYAHVLANTWTISATCADKYQAGAELNKMIATGALA